jgi:type I restriction enzyme M protein
MENIEKIESDLWEAADQLRANSKLTSTQYCIPLLGIIFLRHAANRFDAATLQIKEDQKAGRMPKRPPVKEDYIKRRALYLPETARYDTILGLPKGTNLGQKLIEAMDAIEADYEPLQGVLPKEYTIFDNTLLEDLLKIFSREALRSADGDIFGRIYEYFLMKFAMQGAQDSGEFFTPPSLVKTIVNVIEPEHGTVFDPACGSAGMFVQSSYFIERLGLDTGHCVTFYGQEKTATTIKLAKMNLAVHGLEGNILEANTFYEDLHTLHGRCDFVMANPPFNVDMVDAERIKNDCRLPFGLPGVNKNKKVSNGNYLWISYFYSYLNENGRAGFVMSSQASSAGHGEKEVRRKIIETGHVDVMIAIRANFFYTRAVPCELWFFDKNKPEHLRDKVLMIDGRNIYRKVTRKIYDFTPEQLKNITAIVWLYRGQTEKYLALVKEYIDAVCKECGGVSGKLDAFDASIEQIKKQLKGFAEARRADKDVDQTIFRQFQESLKELENTSSRYMKEKRVLIEGITDWVENSCQPAPAHNEDQKEATQAFDPVADRMKGIGKQIDKICNLARNMVEAAEKDLDARQSEVWNTKKISGLKRGLEDLRREAVDQLGLPVYFQRRILWLETRFPDAVYTDVEGLVKLVDRADIEANDWSLTPGRYVGVAPQEEDEDFDFAEALREIHVELDGLNIEAVQLAATIKKNFQDLGI